MRRPIVSNQWPGVRRKIAKGRAYYYWSGTDPWTRLPDPADDPDRFLRALARVKRSAAILEERQRTEQEPQSPCVPA